jgi:lipopolysaccharide export LptBFGC system permease protein LptF
MGYQVMQFIATSLCITGLIPIKLGVWMPNIVGVILTSTFLGLKVEQ